MTSKWSGVVSLFTLFLIDALPTAKVNNNDAIGYPEVEENHRIRNKDGRQPIYAPSVCPENELYYPGDQSSDRICDCRPAYLYHPESDKCWPSWRQGPCSDGHYLLLTANSAIPVCRKNPCRFDGQVPLNKKCLRLGSKEVCKHRYPTDAVLGVNATTLVVECIRLSLETNIADLPIPERVVGNSATNRPSAVYQQEQPRPPGYSFLVPCPPGSKRRHNGKCDIEI